MRRVIWNLKRLAIDTGGPTAVEYAIMLALVIVLCLPTVSLLGTQATRNFIIIVRSLRSGS